MRELLFLFPTLSMQQGGHNAQMAFLKLSQRFCSARAVTYKVAVAKTPHIDEILLKAKHNPDRYIFVVHWGPDIPALLLKLKDLKVVYIAHSTGWGFSLPDNIPILAVSRHTQAYWGRRAPRNPIFYLPNIIAECFQNQQAPRSVDVLIMKRKSSDYLQGKLLPLLLDHCHVRVIDGWVNDIASEMRNSKIFLYDSCSYWKKQGVSEGFGLPPMEAMACGCDVFSSLNDALSDFLDPGINCQQLGVNCAAFDAENIINAVNNWQATASTSNSIAPWRSDNVARRLNTIVTRVNDFFDRVDNKVTVKPMTMTPWLNLYIFHLNQCLRKLSLSSYYREF